MRLVTSATLGEPGSHVNNKLCNGTASVCQSVCPIYRPLQQRAEGLLLWARRAPQQQDAQQHGVQQQMRAVSRCQLTSEAEHRLVLNALKHVETLIVTGVVERFSVLCKVKIVINSK